MHEALQLLPNLLFEATEHLVHNLWFQTIQSPFFKVGLCRGDGGESEMFGEDTTHIRGEEGWKCRSQMYVLDSETQEGKKDNDGFLLIPGDVVGDR